MICSPCINCPKKKMPKDVCMKKCKKIQEVQDIHIARKEEFFSYAIDYLEENSLGISGVDFV